MKTTFKQLGKAVCYTFLFGLMQVAAATAFTTYFSVKRSIELMAENITLSTMELEREIMSFVVENSSWIFIVSSLMTLFIVWFIFAVRKKKILEETNIVPFSPKLILPIILLALSSVILIQCVFSFLIPPQLLEEYNQSTELLMGGAWPIMLLTNTIIIPINEEVIFRGLVFSRLNKAMPTILAAVISSIAFGLFHGQILWICYAVILGLIMTFIVVKGKSVLASILFHMVFNFFGGTPLLGYLLGDSLVVIAVAGVAGLLISLLMVYRILRLASQ